MMQKWEYCFVEQGVGILGSGTFLTTPDGDRTKRGEPEETIKFLNLLGSEGWEIVDAEYGFSVGGIKTTRWTLKRPKE
jgi:hypothetical protein